MKPTKNIEKDEILNRASFELYQMKAIATETEIQKIENERNSILNEISNSENGIASEDERNRLDELASKEADLYSKWDDYEMTYQVASLSESLQPEEEQEIETDDFFEPTKTEYSDSEIEQAMDELNEIRDAQLTQEQELDMPDF